VFISCRTVKDIPDDLTEAQLIQLGQDCYGSGDYKNAELYYSTVIMRYGMDNNAYIEATYELGHLYLKQKKYEKAEDSFREILSIYEGAAPGTLPGAYKKLSEIELAKIPAKKDNKKTAVQQPAAETQPAADAAPQN
jgi:uncharacterized protein HemY